MIKHDNAIISLEKDLEDIRKEISELDEKHDPQRFASAKQLEIEFVSALRILRMFDLMEI